MKKMIAIAMTLLLAMPFAASAQTIAVSAADGSSYFDVTAGVPFSIRVWMDTLGEAGNAAEFVVTEIQQDYPGVFKLSTTKINNTNLDLGANNLGEYLMAFGGCVDAPTNEMLVTVQYGDFGGVIGDDYEISLRGFEPGDTRPSSFDGSPGFVNCSETKIPLTIGGQDGGLTGSGATFADGHLMLNPTPMVISSEDDSFGSLKARF